MTISLLALGDSYTIGEQVPLYESFPCQAVQMLRNNHTEHHWLAPEILAKTGWTSDELIDAAAHYAFLPEYDFVTLLIGVNNQYRGRDAASFRPEFRQLLKQALSLSGDRPNHVIVLSIPDWGGTPFAMGREVQKIREDIDAFNQVCREEADAAGTHYIDITDSQRSDGSNPEFLAGDGLHPSGKEYAKWAALVSQVIWDHVDD